MNRLFPARRGDVSAVLDVPAAPTFLPNRLKRIGYLIGETRSIQTGQGQA